MLIGIYIYLGGLSNQTQASLCPTQPTHPTVGVPTSPPAILDCTRNKKTFPKLLRDRVKLKFMEPPCR